MDFISTKENKTEAAKANKRYSWQTIPEPIPEELIVETLEADVAVIGGGIAGARRRRTVHGKGPERHGSGKI